MAITPHKISRFWHEFKKRKVIHVVVVYASASFVLIELVNNVYETLRLPEWTPALTLIILAIGFPLAIIFSWIYDISLKGVSKTEKTQANTGYSGFDNSIAVLPFRDMSAQMDQNYFCEGISEEIINLLTQVEGLKVIARTSAFSFKDKQVDMREIGEALNVNTILEGSIRKNGDLLRITTQLINAADGSHIWSDRFDRNLEDLFAFQDEIASSITEALKVKLLGQEFKPPVKRFAANIEVYRLYLRGQYHAQLLTKKGLDQAHSIYEQVCKKAPDFPLLYYGQAVVCWYNTMWGNVKPKVAFPKAEEYISRAIELDGSFGEAYALKGIVNTFYHWDFEEAEQDFKKALELNPGSAIIHSYYSYHLIVTERYTKAMTEAGVAQELDPISCKIATQAGLAYTYGSKFRRAIRELKAAVSMNPDFCEAHAFLAHAYLRKLKIKKAGRCFKKAVELGDRRPFDLANLSSYYYLVRNRELSDALLEELLSQVHSDEYIPPTCFYMIYRLREEEEEAFEWLKRACMERDPYLLYLKAITEKRTRISSVPKYMELLKEFGLS